MATQDQDVNTIIDRQIEGKDIKDIEDIYLENIECAQFTPEFRNKIQSFPNLVCFGLSNVHFNSIKELPQLKRLLRLEICYSTFDLRSLSEIYILYPRLVSLRLAGCNITSLTSLECLTSLPDLAQLDLFNNPVYKFSSEYENFHNKIFEKFPKLLYLDNLKRDYSRACTIPSNQLDPKSLILEVDIPSNKKNEKSGKTPINSQNNSYIANQLNRPKISNKRRIEVDSEEEEDEYYDGSDDEYNQSRQSYNTRNRKQVHKSD